MNIGSKAVKHTAKVALKQNSYKPIFASIILIFSFYICNLSSSILSFANLNNVAAILFCILLFFLFIPVLMGTLRYYWRMIFGVSENPLSVFYYFSSKNLYIKCIKLAGNLLLKAVFLGVVLFLPAITVKILSQDFVYEFLNMPMPLWVGNLDNIFNGLISFCTVILLYFMLKYYIAPILIIADENMDVSEAIHMSNVISKKSSIDFIFLFFSFLGWILLSLLVFPLVFTLPYMLTSYCVHIRYSIAEYNKHVTTAQNNIF